MEAAVDHSQDEKLTINKVAELCGVSKTTISRYLNGKYDNMSAATKERIGAVIAGLDYHPNRSAQRLKAQKAMLIGCVIADVSSIFSAIMLKGIVSACEQAGYQVLFSDSREDPARERRAIQDFLDNRVDGLIVNTTGGNDALLEELKTRLPVVLVDRLTASRELDDVSSPNFDTAHNTTQLLLGMGYERVAFISEEPRGISPRVDRRRGYAAAVTERELEPECIELDTARPEDCAGAIARFVEKYPGRRLALLSANGVTALHALMALSTLNITVGYDFGFCTFDDWAWLQLTRPGITTVQLGTEEKGEAAARLLIGRINDDPSLGDEVQHIVIPSHVILRGSTLSEPVG